MDPSVVAAGAGLLGALVGGAAAVTASFLTMRAAAQSELRRIAVEAALREWEKMHALVAQGRRADIFPPALFIYYNVELLRLVDAGNLTAKSYRELLLRRDQMKEAILADNIQHRSGSSGARTQ